MVGLVLFPEALSISGMLGRQVNLLDFCFFMCKVEMTQTTFKYFDENKWEKDTKRWRQSAKTRPGADCGSDHELLIAKFRLKLKRAGKTTRPFRHDLNQVPYDYIVKVTNRFKGLDLIDRMLEEIWMEVCNIVQEVVSKTPRRRNAKRQNDCLRRPYK